MPNPSIAQVHFPSDYDHSGCLLTSWVQHCIMAGLCHPDNNSVVLYSEYIRIDRPGLTASQLVESLGLTGAHDYYIGVNVPSPPNQPETHTLVCFPTASGLKLNQNALEVLRLAGEPLPLNTDDVTLLDVARLVVEQEEPAQPPAYSYGSAMGRTYRLGGNVAAGSWTQIPSGTLVNGCSYSVNPSPTPEPEPEPEPGDVTVARIASACPCGQVYSSSHLPYVHNRQSRCLPCHRGELFREPEHTCAACATDTSDGWNAYTVAGNRFCVPCYNRYFDRCNSCSDSYTSGSLPEHGHCEGCYRPYWAPQDWSYTGPLTHLEIPKGVTFGVELETNTSPGYPSLEGNTEWGALEEVSTRGAEFVSPVLSGDQGLREIEDFIGASEGWSVSNQCGTHIHLSMDDWTLDDKLKIAFALRNMQDIYSRLMPGRMNNGMCGTCHWNTTALMEAEDIEDFAGTTDKFSWLNLRPLLRLDTIEIRLLQGTLNPILISAWIAFHAQLFDKVRSLTWLQLKKVEQTPDSFILRDEELSEYVGIIREEINQEVAV